MHFYTVTFVIPSAFGHVPTVFLGTGHNDSAASALQRHLAELTRDIRRLVPTCSDDPRFTFVGYGLFLAGIPLL